MFRFSLLKFIDFAKSNKNYIITFIIVDIIFILTLLKSSVSFSNYEILLGAIYNNDHVFLINVYKLFLVLSLIYLAIKNYQYSIQLSNFYVGRRSKENLASNIYFTLLLYFIFIYIFLFLLSFFISHFDNVPFNLIIYDFLYKLMIANISVFWLNKKYKYISLLSIVLTICYLYNFLYFVPCLFLFNVVIYFLQVKLIELE